MTHTLVASQSKEVIIGFDQGLTAFRRGERGECFQKWQIIPENRIGGFIFVNPNGRMQFPINGQRNQLVSGGTNCR